MATPSNPPANGTLTAQLPKVPNSTVSFAPPGQDGRNDTKIITGTNVKTYNCKIRIEFPLDGQPFYAQPAAREILTKLKEAEPKMKFIALEDDTSIAEEVSDIPTAPEEFKKFIGYSCYAPPNSGKKHVLLANIEAGRLFWLIKKDIMKFLGDKKIYIRPHQWSTMEVKSIGFLLDYNPGLEWHQDAKKQIDLILKKCNGGRLIPEYKLVTVTKSFGNDNNRIHSSVVDIHCAKGNAAELKLLFASAEYSERCQYRFVPEGIISVLGPEVYRNIMISNTHSNNSQRVIPIENMTEAALTTLTNEDDETLKKLILLGNKGIMQKLKITIHRTRNTETEGRWLIAFPQEHMVKVRAHLEHVLEKCFPEMIKYDGRENKERFYHNNATPCIVGRKTMMEPEMNNCCKNLAIAFGSPQTGKQDANTVVHKKRRNTVITPGEVSYAEITFPPMNNGMNQAQKINSMSTKEIQEIVAAIVAEQREERKAEQAAYTMIQDDRLEQRLDKLDKKFAETAANQEDKNRDNFIIMADKLSKAFNATGESIRKDMDTRFGEIKLEIVDMGKKSAENVQNSHEYLQNTIQELQEQMFGANRPVETSQNSVTQHDNLYKVAGARTLSDYEK